MSIFFGPKTIEENKHSCILFKQVEKLSNIWLDKIEISFGIERIFKLLFPLLRFLSISFWIECLISLKSNKYSRLFIDLYVIIKIGLIYFFLANNLTGLFFQVVVIYFLLETITILAEIFLISNNVEAPTSIKRSIILILFNYVEVVFCFAIFYLGTDSIKGVVYYLQAIYFSFVTSTTLGYGDFYPKNEIGQNIVILQLITSILFISLFIAYFLSKLNQPNKGKNKHDE